MNGSKPCMEIRDQYNDQQLRWKFSGYRLANYRCLNFFIISSSVVIAKLISQLYETAAREVRHDNLLRGLLIRHFDFLIKQRKRLAGSVVARATNRIVIVIF